MVVGAGPDQLRAIRLAQEMGVRVAAIDRNPSAVGARVAEEFAAVSTDDKQGALAFARDARPDGIMTLVSETGVPVVSFVGEALRLPVPSQSTARLATNKTEMRRAFDRHGVPAVPWSAATAMSDVSRFVRQHGLPVVIKPSESSGQSGVALICGEHQLEAALARALQTSTDSRAIVEKFAAGPEINVCAVVHRGDVEILSVSHRKTLAPPHFGIAFQHVYPFACGRPEEMALRQAARAAIEAIGLEEGIAYPQLVLREDGPVVIEIAARIPGGYMCELAQLASGIDMVGVAIRQALGEPFELDALRAGERAAAAIVDFYTSLSVPSGTQVLRGLQGIEQAARMPGVARIEFLIGPGDPVPPLTSSRGRFGAVIVTGETLAQAAERLRAVNKAVRVH